MRVHLGCMLAAMSVSFPALAQTSVDVVIWNGGAVLGPGITVKTIS